MAAIVVPACHVTCVAMASMSMLRAASNPMGISAAITSSAPVTTSVPVTTSAVAMSAAATRPLQGVLVSDSPETSNDITSLRVAEWLGQRRLPSCLGLGFDGPAPRFRYEVPKEQE